MNGQTVRALIGTLAVVAADVACALGMQLDAGALADVACAVVMVAATAWGCWKNHNFTKAAQDAQRLLDGIKSGSVPKGGE